MPLEEKTVNREVVVIRCKGSFDTDYFKRFETNVLKFIEQGARKFVLDWKDVETVSSSGIDLLQLLIELVNNKNGSVVFCSISDDVNSILKAKKCEDVFPNYPDEKKALERLKKE